MAGGRWPHRPRTGAPRRQTDHAEHATPRGSAPRSTDRREARPARELAPAGGNPRLVAARLLLRLERGEELTLGDAIDAVAELGPRDRGLAREIALGAVRYARLYDALADRFLRDDRQPPGLRVVLRLAAHQLFALDRVPVHAVVSTSVDLVPGLDLGRRGGVVNAVARRLAELRSDQRHGDGPLGRLAPSDIPSGAGVQAGLPDALVADLGTTASEPGRSLDDLNRVPPLCLRTRPGQRVLEHPSVVRRDGQWTWWRDARAAIDGPVAAGHAVVQDFSQGKVAELAAVYAGERVLDLCAAPGGKSLALHDAGAHVVAADRNRQRLNQVPAMLTRVVMDGTAPALAAGWDVVIVDAPCSNTGVLGRRPEARLRYHREALDGLLELQRQLLARGAELVAPGGRLIYSTCSLVPEENHDLAASLPGWRIDAEATAWPDGWQAGGYAARLVRAS